MAYQRKAGDRITFWEVIHRATAFSSDDWEFLLNEGIIVTFGKKISRDFLQCVMEIIFIFAIGE